ncbi:DUF2306 domain-containing protein [uncultured Psychroserpens sp.]|uniref:DUF2306 domain-containing protein n=1 Tax=uncultured Psychroserpens sp. TaxID=255436 RepID=UPI002630DFD0|nr:DUF2306 domain-containing protein [uncultured Psychroserpens sp.]
MIKKIAFIVFALSSVAIGLYPIIYLFIDANFGLLSSKPEALLNNSLWNFTFYTHIYFGGLALGIGWIQFNHEFRYKNLRLHKIIGKVYTVAVLLSGFSSLYIACFATGGIIAIFGFTCLGIIWLVSTIAGYLSIKKGNIVKHQEFMIFSYAACFAAVTLRIWLPSLTVLFQDFIIAYKIVAWLCWVPNIVVAAIIVRRLQSKNV